MTIFTLPLTSGFTKKIWNITCEKDVRYISKLGVLMSQDSSQTIRARLGQNSAREDSTRVRDMARDLDEPSLHLFMFGSKVRG